MTDTCTALLVLRQPCSSTLFTVRHIAVEKMLGHGKAKASGEALVGGL
jgi:HEAT repeat protein